MASGAMIVNMLHKHGVRFGVPESGLAKKLGPMVSSRHF
jgi:hypothetical protein